MSLKENAGPLFAWAHESSPSIPSFVDGQTKKFCKEELEFWKLVNDYVSQNDAFPHQSCLNMECKAFIQKLKVVWMGAVNVGVYSEVLLLT